MDAESWPLSDEGQLWIAYQRATQLLERAVDQYLRTTAGLTHPEFEILSRLAAAPGHQLRMGALAAIVVSPKTRLNYQINQLERRGLVTREPDPDDRRGLNAVLTDEGLSVFLRVVPGQIETVQRHFLAQLDDWQRQGLKIMLDSITEHLSAGPKEADAPCGQAPAR